MSWQLVVNLRETFAELAGTNGHEVFLGRASNRGDKLVSGLQELIADLPDFDSTKCKIKIIDDHRAVTLREGWGQTVALLITEGFENLIQIGDQSRSKELLLQPEGKEHLVLPENCYALTERGKPDGSIEVEFDPSELEFMESRLKLNNITSIAVVCLHSKKNSAHEEIIAQWFRERGYSVTASNIFEGNELVRVQKTIQAAYLSSSRIEFQNQILALGFQEKNLEFLDSALKKCFLQDTEIQVCISEDRISLSVFENGKLRFDGRLKASPFWTVNVDKFGYVRLGDHTVGSDPGPAGFGRGMSLTVFDLLSHVHQITGSNFPKFKFDPNQVKKFLSPISINLKMKQVECALSFIQLFLNEVAQEILRTVTRLNIDTSKSTLTCTGILGGPCAPELASALGVRKIFVPPFSQWHPLLAQVMEGTKKGFQQYRGALTFTSETEIPEGKVYDI